MELPACLGAFCGLKMPPYCQESGPDIAKAFVTKRAIHMQLYEEMTSKTASNTGSKFTRVNTVCPRLLTLRPPLKNKLGSKSEMKRVLIQAERNVRHFLTEMALKSPKIRIQGRFFNF